jgi:hypothetical protein
MMMMMMNATRRIPFSPGVTSFVTTVARRRGMAQYLELLACRRRSLVVASTNTNNNNNTDMNKNNDAHGSINSTVHEEPYVSGDSTHFGFEMSRLKRRNVVCVKSLRTWLRVMMS